MTWYITAWITNVFVVANTCIDNYPVLLISSFLLKENIKGRQHHLLQKNPGIEQIIFH